MEDADIADDGAIDSEAHPEASVVGDNLNRKIIRGRSPKSTNSPVATAASVATNLSAPMQQMLMKMGLLPSKLSVFNLHWMYTYYEDKTLKACLIRDLIVARSKHFTIIFSETWKRSAEEESLTRHYSRWPRPSLHHPLSWRIRRYDGAHPGTCTSNHEINYLLKKFDVESDWQAGGFFANNFNYWQIFSCTVIFYVSFFRIWRS